MPAHPHPPSEEEPANTQRRRTDGVALKSTTYSFAQDLDLGLSKSATVPERLDLTVELEPVHLRQIRRHPGCSWSAIAVCALIVPLDLGYFSTPSVFAVCSVTIFQSVNGRISLRFTGDHRKHEFQFLG